jgi:glutamate--cysteine ligase catalytic subunit
MARAQQRDAAQSSKFYFRKDVGSRRQSATSSAASSDCGSGCNSPVGGPTVKDKKMRNCFPDPPLPENGTNLLPVEEEYEEMTMNEIMNGKEVCIQLLTSLQVLKL